MPRVTHSRRRSGAAAMALSGAVAQLPQQPEPPGPVVEGVVQVDEERRPRPQDAVDLAQRPLGVRQVVQHAQGEPEVERVRREGELDRAPVDDPGLGNPSCGDRGRVGRGVEGHHRQAPIQHQRRTNGRTPNQRPGPSASRRAGTPTGTGRSSGRTSGGWKRGPARTGHRRTTRTRTPRPWPGRCSPGPQGRDDGPASEQLHVTEGQVERRPWAARRSGTTASRSGSARSAERAGTTRPPARIPGGDQVVGPDCRRGDAAPRTVRPRAPSTSHTVPSSADPVAGSGPRPRRPTGPRAEPPGSAAARTSSASAGRSAIRSVASRAAGSVPGTGGPRPRRRRRRPPGPPSRRGPRPTTGRPRCGRRTAGGPIPGPAVRTDTGTRPTWLQPIFR